MLLWIAAVLTVLLGLAHSYLGERYILIRLFRRGDLPRLLGGEWFTRRTLRFAWHLTSVAFWSFGAILAAAATLDGAELRLAILCIVAGTFLLSALVALFASRGRHLSWVLFLAIATLALLAAF